MMKKEKNGLIKRLLIPFILVVYLIFAFGDFVVNTVELAILVDIDELEKEVAYYNKTVSTGQEYTFNEERKYLIQKGFLLNQGKIRKQGPDGSVEKGSGFSISLKGHDYLLLFLVVWLNPLYRYNFAKKKPDVSLVSSRIIRLPVFLLVIAVLESLALIFGKSYLYYQTYGDEVFYVTPLLVMTSFIRVAFLGYFIIEFLPLFIKRYLAEPFFSQNDLHGLKKGTYFSMRTTNFFRVLCLGVIPMAMILLIFFHFSRINLIGAGLDCYTSITEGKGLSLLLPYARDLIPFVIAVVFLLIILTYQFLALFVYEKSIQKPMNSLINRMRLVSKGDFKCKSSVLQADEIGQLKGHFNLMLSGLQERERIKDTFGKYVSQEIAQKIMKTGKINLSGEELESTILFSDIRNFTPLSEAMTAPQLIEFLNTYFSYITVPIVENRGVINKFIGDAVMAIFSPVFGVENHAEAAVRAAMGMQEALIRFNQEKLYQEIACGVGIHTGTLVAGNIGTEDRMEYTVIGDTVNVASRIEGMTKDLSANILISSSTREAIKNDVGADFSECPPVMLKGKSNALILFKVAKI